MFSERVPGEVGGRGGKKSAFTLTEVVITLIVIGIVASATIPMLNNNVADKKWNVARQKAKATIGEAFKLMTVNGEITTNKTDGSTMTTADFVNTVIPKYLKLEKTCAPNDYDKCGFPSAIKIPNGQNVTGLEPKDYKWTELSPATVSKGEHTPPGVWVFTGLYQIYTQKYGTEYNTSYYFRTLDGFSAAFLYNPYCVSDKIERFVYHDTSIAGGPYYAQGSMDAICLMVIYDMNGKQGPNTVGKDIGFVGSFYNGYQTQAAAVLPHPEEKYYNQVPAAPKWNGKNDYWTPLANYCNNLGKDHDWIMPDIDEMSLMFLNKKLVNNSKNTEQKWFYSRTHLNGASAAYFQAVAYSSGDLGLRAWFERSYSHTWGPRVRCVRSTALK